MSSASSDDGPKEKKTPLDRFMRKLLRQYKCVPVELVADEATSPRKLERDRHVVIKNMSAHIRGGQSHSPEDRWSNSASPSSMLDFDLPVRSRHHGQKSLQRNLSLPSLASLAEELQQKIYRDSSYFLYSDPTSYFWSRERSTCGITCYSMRFYYML
jgi:hypothetical protein